VAVAHGGAALRDAASYRTRVENDSSELDELAAALLVHVTSFFRDASSSARSNARPSSRARRNRFRGTLCGPGRSEAATGEEAYSLAIVLSRACESRGMAYEVLATDRDLPSLEIARDGLYARRPSRTPCQRSSFHDSFARGGLFPRRRDRPRSTCTRRVMTSWGRASHPRKRSWPRVRPRPSAGTCSFTSTDRFQAGSVRALAGSSGAAGAVSGHAETTPQSSRRSFKDSRASTPDSGSFGGCPP